MRQAVGLGTTAVIADCLYQRSVRLHHTSALARSYAGLLAKSDPPGRREWAVWREATACFWRAPNTAGGQVPPLQAVSLPGRTRSALQNDGVTRLWRG